MTVVFGICEPGISYRRRRAAYGVLMEADGSVGVIILANGYFWLPGGGVDMGETPEAALVREACEELARGVRIVAHLGHATEYFYSRDDDCHFQTEADLYRMELTEELGNQPEYRLDWRPVEEVLASLFLQCHRLAVESCCAGIIPQPHPRSQ
jgi:8-oxo-dGTP diphosphatase